MINQAIKQEILDLLEKAISYETGKEQTLAQLFGKELIVEESNVDPK